jgi:hypothetical protein
MRLRDAQVEPAAPAISLLGPTWILQSNVSDGYRAKPTRIGVDLYERTCALTDNLIIDLDWSSRQELLE